jgi:nucleoside-diphosphate-sugar epimerase
VKCFVFASSCSVYGVAEGKARRENDPLIPLTAYARSKVATEQSLQQLDLGGMRVTCLRFATACGMYDRLRLDLVLNDFVAGSLSSGEITILSDGTPWRPLIDVRDMARAIEWGILRKTEQGGQFLCVNAGSDTRNHRIRDLAAAVAQAVPGTSVRVNAAAPLDSRSYRVDFSLFRDLAPEYQPQIDLDGSIRGLIAGLQAVDFADRDFRGSSHNIRLKTLASLVAAGQLSPELRWRLNRP